MILPIYTESIQLCRQKKAMICINSNNKLHFHAAPCHTPCPMQASQAPESDDPKKEPANQHSLTPWKAGLFSTHKGAR
jgi:hypothetical protein